MAKIYHVIQIKLIQLGHENVHMITDLPAKHIQALSQWQTFLRVLPTRWRQKSTGIDMEQNYVTVTLCIDEYPVDKFNNFVPRRYHLPVLPVAMHIQRVLIMDKIAKHFTDSIRLVLHLEMQTASLRSVVALLGRLRCARIRRWIHDVRPCFSSCFSRYIAFTLCMWSYGKRGVWMQH